LLRSEPRRGLALTETEQNVSEKVNYYYAKYVIKVIMNIYASNNAPINYNHKDKLKTYFSFDNQTQNICFKELNIPRRVFNVLGKKSVHTVGQLLDLSLEDIIQTKYIGHKLANTILDILKDLGKYKRITPGNSITTELIKSRNDSENMRGILSKLNSKSIDILTKRYIEQQTLDKVGEIYGITRERVRQIQRKAETAILNNKEYQPWLAKIQSKISHLVISESLVNKKELIAYLSKGSDNKGWELLVDIILDKIDCKVINDTVFGTSININGLVDYLQKIGIEKLDIVAKTISKYGLNNDKLDIINILDRCGYIIKSDYVINEKSLINKVLYIFKVLNRPIHISELKGLYSKEFPGHVTQNYLKNRVINNPLFIRCNKGTYMLRDNVDQGVLRDDKLHETIKEILNIDKQPLSVSYLMKKLHNKYLLEEVILLLDTNGEYVDLGREYYALREWGNINKRSYIEDIIIKLFHQYQRPLNLHDIAQGLAKYGKHQKKWSLEANLNKNWKFIKVSKNTWYLRKNQAYPDL
jgi:hypothetical protein